MNDIDFVITYVDGNDIEWQKEKSKYSPDEQDNINSNRYRVWNNLQYLFRGIEVFAPWVRKVHFVTYGHLPAWLNTEHPQLNIVRHEQYIPQEWLPTFNNRCIELNLHRISGLAEQFVYFNDDMFLLKSVSPEDFFVDGKPCDTAVLTASNLKLRKTLSELHLAPFIDTAIINKYFNLREVVLKNPTKWFNFKYGLYNLRTLSEIFYRHFKGFVPFHLPYSYLKSTFEKIWEVEPEICKESSMHKFRCAMDINQWLMNYWQFASGNFKPRKANFGKWFQLYSIEDSLVASTAIHNHIYKVICLNDMITTNEQDFSIISNNVNSALDSLLPKKSKFEK